MRRSFSLVPALLCLAALACGDDGGVGPDGPSDPAVTEHLRICEERCAQELRCSAMPPVEADCLAQCEAMANDACIPPHADYFECTSFVTCDDRYDDRLAAQCRDELTELFRECEPWREPPTE